MQPFEGYEQADYERIMPDLEGFESFQANLLAAWIIDHFELTHGVIDVGCGSMFYLRQFQHAHLRTKTGAEYRVPILGIDALQQPYLTPYERVDLRFPWKPFNGYRYSLALCLEVAEHLKPEYAETIIDTLCACSDTIVFSAATPGQGGEHHHNERPTSYWLELFAARGYGLHPLNKEFHSWLQTLGAYRERYQVCGWFIDHTSLLTHNG